MTWPIVQVWSMSKMKLNCHDRLNWERFVTKTKQDNDLTDRKGAVYIENETEHSWLIGLRAICD